MNFLNIIFLFIYVHSALSVNIKDWLAYKTSFKLEFNDVLENKVYQDTWKKNIAFIGKHNEKYFNNSQTYSMGINQYTHLNHDEFISLYTGYKRQHSLENSTTDPKSNNNLFLENTNIPESIDWSTNSIVMGPVKNQGTCG